VPLTPAPATSSTTTLSLPDALPICLNVHRWYMQAMPQTNGSYTLIKMEEEVGYPNLMPDIDPASMPRTLLFFKQRVNAPARLAGNVLLVHDTLDQLKEPRMA